MLASRNRFLFWLRFQGNILPKKLPYLTMERYWSSMKIVSPSKVRKSFAVVAAMALAVSVLTFVSSSAFATSKVDPTWACVPSKSKVVKIRLIEYFAGPARTPLLNAFARNYEAIHPGVKIDIISPSQADSPAKMTQLLQARNIDIVEPGGAIAGQALSAKQLANIYPYFVKTKAWAKLTSYSQYEAKLYGKTSIYVVPNGYYVKAAFVRADRFKAAGIPIPKTWEDIYNAKSMQKDNQFVYAMRGARASFTQAIFAIRAYVAPNLNAGGYYTKAGMSMFTTPQAKAALDEVMKIWKDASPTASVSWGYPEMVQGFIDGVANYLIQDNEVIQMVEDKFQPYAKGNWVMAQMPKGPTGYSAQDVSGTGWSVASASKCKNVAAGFIDFLTQDPQASTFARAYGVSPVTVTAAKDPFFKTGAWAIYDKIGKDPKELKLDGSDIAKPCYGEFFVQADKDMQSLYRGDKTTTQVLSEWASFWDGPKCKAKA
jgi:multiple sugar transport system substrate-binding protein